MSDEPEEEATVEPQDNKSSGPMNAPVRVRAIFREYHTRKAASGRTALIATTAAIHDIDDTPVPIDALIFSMALSAGAKDGEEIEILIRRRGPPLFPLIRWIIDQGLGLHAVKLVPKKLVIPTTIRD